MSVIIPGIISRLRLGFEWVQVPIPTLPIPTVPNTNSNPNCNLNPNPNSNPNPLHYPFRNVGIAVVGIAAASRFELLFIL